mmetsp:Transcript_26162/g.61018  ORF Transcript_26162/g.61018 Transcript_26162/m.61018 type:complete len:491 (-) Transcript_26162:103-1575(-)
MTVGKRKRNLQGGGKVAPVGSEARGARRKVIAKRRYDRIAPTSTTSASGGGAAAVATSPGAVIASIASAASDWTKLSRWLEQGGAQCGALEIRPDGPSVGLGAFAKRDLAAGEVALTVPCSLMLTPQASLEDPAVSTVADYLSRSGETAMPELLLSLRLCRAKANPADRFHAYATSLPESAPGAACWDPVFREVLAQTSLEPSLTAADMELNRWEGLLANAMQSAPAAFEPKAALARPCLQWARGMVQSRHFPGGFAGTNADGTPIAALCMVPLLDLLNHKSTEEVTVRVRSGLLEFFCDKPLKSGTQVWNNYGAKSNSELLMCYGFATSDNSSDVLPLNWAASAQGAMEVRGKVGPTIELTMNGIPEVVVDDIENRQDTAQFIGLLKALLALRRSLKQQLAKVPETLNFTVCKGPLARARKASIQEFLEGQLRIIEVCLEEMQSADPDQALDDGPMAEGEANQSDAECEQEDSEEEMLLRRRKRRRKHH